jgi:hypothetical protein
MMQDFLSEVRSIVEPVLVELGFQLDSFVDDVDEGGRPGFVAFYSSKDCIVQVYRSTRAGEVNCMIAPLDAPKVFGPYDRSKKWQYLPRFAIRQGTSLEEIMADRLPVAFPTNGQQLEWVRGRIEKYFPVAHAGVLEPYPKEWEEPRVSGQLGPSAPSDAGEQAASSPDKSFRRSIAAKLKWASGSRRPR